jgi:hypothetical protein
LLKKTKIESTAAAAATNTKEIARHYTHAVASTKGTHINKDIIKARQRAHIHKDDNEDISKDMKKKNQ